MALPANEIDCAARILIRYCLTRAAELATERSKEYVAIAEAIRSADDYDIEIIRILLSESDQLKTPSTDELAGKRIQDRLDRLETFSRMASELSAQLKKELEKIEQSKSH